MPPGPTVRRAAGWRSARRSGAGGWLALLAAVWLAAQLLGQAHGVLHARMPWAAQAASQARQAPHGDGVTALASALRRAFHPQGDAADPKDDGTCRLYSHAAQGGLAAGAPAVPLGSVGADVATTLSAVSADTAPRHAPAARGPPAAG